MAIELIDMGKSFLSLRGLRKTELEKRNEAKLRDLLLYVWDNSTFYREYYSQCAITRTDLMHIPYDELPYTSKEMLMQHFDDVVTDDQLKFKEISEFLSSNNNPDDAYLGKYCALHTSGTSGKQGIFVYDKNVWRNNTYKLALTVLKPQFKVISKLTHRRIRIAYVGATDGHYTGITYSRQMPKVLFKMMDISINQDYETSIEALNKFQPDYLVGYANALNYLLPYYKRGELKINPIYVINSGEQLTRELATNIHSVLGLDPIDLYIATEGVIAYRESTMKPMYVHNDLAVVEVMNERGRYCQPNELGEVVLTNLTNRVMPIIRYKIGDKAIPLTLSENNRCVSIKKLFGRKQLPLPIKLDNGKFDVIHPNILVEFYVPGVEQFQFVAQKNNTVLIRYVSKKQNDQLISKRFQHLLAQKNAANSTHFVIAHVPELERNRGGKINLVTHAG